MKNLLVTGAGGYLGTELIKQLMKTENKVYALTSNKLKIEERFGSSVICLSNDELFAEKSFLSEIDIVVHCAFARSNNSKEITESLNFTKELFKFAVNTNASIINISSRSVYGQNPLVPWLETSEILPNDLYSLGKFSSEVLTEAVFKNKNPFTNIRLAGLLVHNFDDRIVNKFIINAISGIPLKIIGGKQQFSVLDIRDAAAGIINLINTPTGKWKKIYNLGYKRSYSLEEIANIVKKVAKEYLLEVEIIKESSDKTLYAEMDSTLFYNDTGWQPQYDIEKTVRSIFENKITSVH